LGLVIEGNLVRVDHSVKEHLITNVEGNPKVSKTKCGLHVTSLFTRLKTSGKARRDRNHIGDNCHMLYALKQKDGLVTDMRSIRLLIESGRQILASIAGQIQADSVVYMPSGYAVSNIIGKRCARALGAQMFDGVFRKTSKLSAYEMLDRADRNGDISTIDKKMLLFRLRKSEVFSLKDIPIPFRGIFTPLHVHPGFTGDIHGRVLLVDDLLASGQTLSVAAGLIRQMPNVAAVAAVCLFSDV